MSATPVEYHATPLNDVLQIALHAAIKAGEEVLKIRAAPDFKINFKGEIDLVTAGDLASERIVISAIREQFPAADFLSEEANPVIHSPEVLKGPIWILDPIDGTTNYAHGHLHFAVSLALVVGGKPVLGVVHAPALKETYTAVVGCGAFLNGERLQVSKCSRLKEALVTTGFPYNERNFETEMRRIRTVTQSCRDLRRLGAASIDLCWVASGRLDCYYETLKVWDIAAGRLVVTEAGGVVSNLKTPPAEWADYAELFPEEMIACNQALLPLFKEIL